MFVRGGRQRLAPRGHGELHALAAHGDRGLQRGRVAGGHGGCGERARGASGQRAFGAFRWRLESPRWRIRPETRMEGGSGARMGDVLAPSPVESDMMLAATCGAAWWAGFTPRGIPIGRVVGSLARIGVRANSRCLPGSQIFSDPPFRTSAASRNPKPVRGFASSHPLAPRCPRVPSGCSPAGASLRAPPRASSAMGRPVDAPAPARPGCARSCPPRRAASAGRDIGTRRATAAPCRCGGDHLRGPPRGGPPVIPSPGKPSTRRLPRTPRRPLRSTRAP